MKSLLLALSVLTVVSLTGCSSDSNPQNENKTSFDVRYEATGTCEGSQLSNNSVSLAYTTDGGGTEGSIETLPFTFATTINTTGPNTAIAMAVDCPGSGSATNTITSSIFVDGDLKDSKSATGENTLLATAVHILNPETFGF